MKPYINPVLGLVLGRILAGGQFPVLIPILKAIGVPIKVVDFFSKMYWGISPYIRTKQHRFEPVLCVYQSRLQMPTDYQPGYTHLPSGGEKKSKNLVRYRTSVLNFFEFKKKCFSNCQFFASPFMKTAGSFMFLKYPKTDGSLILCFSHTNDVNSLY